MSIKTAPLALAVLAVAFSVTVSAQNQLYNVPGLGGYLGARELNQQYELQQLQQLQMMQQIQQQQEMQEQRRQQHEQQMQLMREQQATQEQLLQLERQRALQAPTKANIFAH